MRNAGRGLGISTASGSERALLIEPRSLPLAVLIRNPQFPILIRPRFHA